MTARNKPIGSLWRVRGRDYLIVFAHRWFDIQLGLLAPMSYDHLDAEPLTLVPANGANFRYDPPAAS